MDFSGYSFPPIIPVDSRSAVSTSLPQFPPSVSYRRKSPRFEGAAQDTIDISESDISDAGLIPAETLSRDPKPEIQSPEPEIPSAPEPKILLPEPEIPSAPEPEILLPEHGSLSLEPEVTSKSEPENASRPKHFQHPKIRSRRASSQTLPSELDRIDELDETDPMGVGFHHQSPYEAIAAALGSKPLSVPPDRKSGTTSQNAPVQHVDGHHQTRRPRQPKVRLILNFHST